MKKLNEYQASIIKSGLEMWARELKLEIAEAEAAGKNPIMTRGFVDMQLTETLEAIKLLTKRNK
jgi:hypothetical protein